MCHNSTFLSPIKLLRILLFCVCGVNKVHTNVIFKEFLCHNDVIILIRRIQEYIYINLKYINT